MIVKPQTLQEQLQKQLAQKRKLIEVVNTDHWTP